MSPPASMTNETVLSGATKELVHRLAGVGIQCFGRFEIETGDIAVGEGAIAAGTGALLFGNAGPSMWRHFSQSPEYRDGQPEPLDRWTRRIVVGVTDAAGQGTHALFPFGAPVWPFQRWARRAMGVDASPLGMLIHPEYGLWFALRCAIAVPGLSREVEKVIQLPEKMNHPCDACTGKPCMNSCPVDAFSVGNFEARRCRSYLANERPSTGGPNCMKDGCAARNACPVGVEWRYPPEQLRFHMDAFAV